MAKKKTTTKTARKTSRSTKTAGARIRGAWSDVVAAVSTAQANLEGEVKKLLRRSRISTKDAATMLADVRALADRERRKAAKELRARAAELQARVQKERQVAARALDDAVRSGLAALNIPSRAEVAALTRKVDELSKKIQRSRR
jgi:Poly(hydroxyalcanoate) granule associated protein (phasin)